MIQKLLVTRASPLGYRVMIVQTSWVVTMQQKVLAKSTVANDNL